MRGFAVVLVGAALVVAVLVGLVAAVGSDRSPRGDGLSPARVDRGTPVAQGAALPVGVDLAGWARSASATSGVPARALEAYGAAEIEQRALTPQCGLSWATLAGIGRVESDHGNLGRSRLGDDGRPRPPVIGVPLDGAPGIREIRDTDGGALDGDPVYDRAVGPMQFLPTTWARYGEGDPQQIDDAARAAAAYLCDAGRDTVSGEGWWDAVLTYNRSGEYARLVWAAADDYAMATSVAR